jgi:M6 family metalloprotease-like protein
MRKSIIATSTAALLLSMLPHSADAASVGKKCPKRGVERVVGNTTLFCSGKNKLTWKRKKTPSVNNAAPTTNSNPVPTPSPTPIPKFLDTDIKLLDSVENCKIPRPEGLDVGVGTYGFPRGPNFFPSEGTLDGLVIPVDFADSRAKIKPEENSRPYVEEFVEFYRAMSKGKLNFRMTTLDSWLSLPLRASQYAGKWPHNPEMENYVRLVISLVDERVDFAKYDFVAIIPVDDVKDFFQTAPVVASGNSDHFMSKDGPVSSLFVGSDPAISMGGVKWKWFAHETGHLFGIDHPHSYENNDKKLASIFSLMDFGYVAAGFYGWERWLVDWIPSENVRCVDMRTRAEVDHTFNLIPLGDVKGSEIVVYRIANQKAFVIENRRSTKFDNLKPNYEGVLVYSVDSSKIGGAITPILGSRFVIDQSKPEYNGARVVGTLRVGEQVSFEGLQIKVLAEEGNNFVVKVSNS